MLKLKRIDPLLERKTWTYPGRSASFSLEVAQVMLQPLRLVAAIWRGKEERGKGDDAGM